ncbi:SRPBCC domain-containing protein [Leifsonia poae]|uniref:SRPBCC domain-containing protein n=1 Tax=Leifsonia poae TaxID=110933 RepID=UPI003D66AA65
MSDTTTSDEAVATTTVTADPDRAFRVFTENIGTWWHRGTIYWNDSERGQRLEFEPGVGGRLQEIYEDGAYEIGRVTAWEPGERLTFTWREQSWNVDGVTTVDVRFEAVDGGTAVTVRHGGWGTITQANAGAGGYTAGWNELLGWFVDEANAGAA